MKIKSAQLFFLVLFAVTFCSCCKNFSAKRSIYNKVDPAILAEAKEFFIKDTTGRCYCPCTGALQSDFTPKVFNLDWDKAVFNKLRNAHAYQIIVPVSGPDHRIYAKQEIVPGNPESGYYFIKVSQLLVYIKNLIQDTEGVYIWTVVPDKDYYDKCEDKDFICPHFPNFSGYVIYHFLNGRPRDLYVHKNKKVSAKILHLFDYKNNEVSQQKFDEAKTAIGNVVYLQTTPVAHRYEYIDKAQ